MIKLNTEYIHYRNKKSYITLNYCKMQTNNIWLDSIIYKNEEGEIFVRELSDFENKFKEKK